MAEPDALHVCNVCGYKGAEKYCGRCGHPYVVKRITLPGLLHDVFHLFTHLDKGFGYTLKTLVLQPGHMQRAYIAGDRARHQKPFSMFFVCATIAALTRYWAFLALLKYYHVGSMSEANFSHAYMVMLHVALVPVYTLITYLLFYKSNYNVAETGVLILYTIAVIFLVAAITTLLKFIWPHLDTAYIEFPIFLVYNTITLSRFYYTRPRWEVILKSIGIAVAIFLLIQNLEDFVIDVLSRSSDH